MSDTSQYWRGLPIEEQLELMTKARDAALQTAREERQSVQSFRGDCLTLALRLLAEDPSSHAPETAEVLSRYEAEALELLNSGSGKTAKEWVKS